MSEQAEKDRAQAIEIANAAERRAQAAERSYNVIAQERAQSFEMLATAVGGVGCTPYQAEVDIEIVGRIRALKAHASRMEDAAFHFLTCAVCRQTGPLCADGQLFEAAMRGEVR